MAARYRRIQLAFLFLFTVIVATLGLGALFPSLRQQFASTLGMKADAGEKMAVNSCVPETSGDPDDIYFLSCGGIY
jgi:hypothetical protein